MDPNTIDSSYLPVSEEPAVHGTLRRAPVFIGTRKVSLFNRFQAKAIDTIIAVALFYLGQRLIPVWGYLAAPLYLALKDGFASGQSLGKRIVGIRVIEESLGLTGGFRESMLRNLPFALIFLCSGSRLLWLPMLVLIVPWCILELGLVYFVPTGVRLGDIVANTSLDENLDNFGTEFQEL